MVELVEATRKERVRDAWIEQLLEDNLFFVGRLFDMYVVLSCHTGRGTRGAQGGCVVKMVLKAEPKAIIHHAWSEGEDSHEDRQGSSPPLALAPTAWKISGVDCIWATKIMYQT